MEYCHPTEGLGGSLVPEIRKLPKITEKMRQWRQDANLHPCDLTTCEDPQVTDHPRTSFSTSQTLSGYDLGRNPTKIKDLLCRKIHGGIFMISSMCTRAYVLF